MPINVTKHEHNYFKVHAFVMLTVVDVVVPLFFGVLFYNIGFVSAGYSQVFLSVTSFIFLYAFKYSGKLDLFTNILIFQVFLVITYNIYHSSGIYSPILSWLIILPLASICFARRNSAVFWTLVICIEMIVWAVLEYKGYYFPTPYGEFGKLFMTVSMPLTLVLYLFVLGKIYAYTSLKNIGDLSDENADLNIHNQQLKIEKSNFEKLAITDVLTGLYNRYYFDYRAKNEYKRLARESLPVSIAMLDLDYFKQLNDRYGHAVGDECLKLFASEAKKQLKRPSDIFARYGGEEFVVLISDINIENTKKIFENIRSAIERIVLNAGDDSVYMTVSIGVVHGIPDAKLDFKYLVHLADEALYKAKKSGKNKVEYKTF